MISGDPSTIPGLSEETRKILEERARRAGRPFGEWLNEMLAADRAARAGTREERAGSGETWTQERVARLKERIDQLSVTRGEPNDVFDPAHGFLIPRCSLVGGLPFCFQSELI